jgi:UDP-3-O-[3-hydroxymyristoyl] glucosamine N-acyltransferase
MTITLKDIVSHLGGEVLNHHADVSISRVGSLAYAGEDAIAFFNDTKYSQALGNTHAAAVILRPQHAELTSLPKIITDNPYAYFAKVSALLNPPYTMQAGIHSTAQLSASARVAESASIGPNVVVADDVVIGDYVVIGANCVIERNVSIGAYTKLEANVTLKHGSTLGQRCHLYSGCVIGNDGFGYAEEQGAWVKIPQVGRVMIGNDVDIGANTTVDRGAIDDTVIEDGVKLDNLIQIAHNCRIGAHTVIAGCVGIAGSAVIGQHCKIGGAAMILGHLTIADGVTISPGSMIMRSIKQSGTYTALMPFQEHEAWLKTAANIRHLNQLTDKIKSLEVALEQLRSNLK